MQLHFLGHSGFHIHGDSCNILIDPFLSGNPTATQTAEDFSPTHIVLTHGHGDHYGDCESIAQRSGATIISSFEIINYVAARNLKGHPMNPGGSFVFPFGRLRFTPAWHSNSLPDGSYGGMPMGVILEIEGKRIYHAGDTALFGDMALIGQRSIDVAIVPIGDNFTMGPEDALEAIKLIKPKQVIPVHYNTFDLIKQDATAFRDSVAAQTSSECIVLEPGAMLEL